MELYIGGYAQGKLEYVLRKYSDKAFIIIDGARDYKEIEGLKQQNGIIINHFHLLMKHLLAKGENVEELFEVFMAEHPTCIIISDEIGNGIVPMEKAEREYRERVGRLLTYIASKADSVERIICGMGQKLK
ncbi:MAG: hypothetical protein E7231_10870 [Cellulosilyticum sp.]|nr:hypothetical protein [Cellulosilyticum sp.]